MCVCLCVCPCVCTCVCVCVCLCGVVQITCFINKVKGHTELSKDQVEGTMFRRARKEESIGRGSCLECELVNEERVITVWTLKCYIKRIKAAFIREQINRVTSKEMLPEVVAYAG